MARPPARRAGDVKRIAVVVAVVAALVVAAVVWRSSSSEAERGFTTEGTEIIGPDGTPFVPRGVNMLGPDAFFNAQGVTAGQAKVLKEAWNVNTVRLNSCLPSGCPYNDLQNENNDDLDALVDEYTGEGIVVMIALHQVEPGTWPDDQTLDDIVAWWEDVARRYGDNPMVWFNLLNEPGSDKPASRRWVEIHERIIEAVRATGADNLLVVDGSSWGQDAGGEEPGTVRTEDSAILSFGEELAAMDDDLVFSFHVYNQWGYADTDDATRDARMADYIDRVKALGVPLLIGEAGGADDRCCDSRALATQTMFRVAPPRGVGILMWHGQSVDDNRLVDWDPTGITPDDIDDWERPTNLSWMGQLFWDYTHT